MAGDKDTKEYLLSHKPPKGCGDLGIETSS
jgi:hypothetical protein